MVLNNASSEVLRYMDSTEKILFALRALYREAGYAQYRMSKFEEYDLYSKNKDFLISDGVITFTDKRGQICDAILCIEMNIANRSIFNSLAFSSIYATLIFAWENS